MRYNWKFRARNHFDRDKIKKWSLKFNLSVDTIKLLVSRGIDTEDKISTFISPLLRYLPPLNSWKELIAGAEFLANKIEKKSHIGIWGDYDADGICSAAIVYDFLKKLGCDVTIYIPHRIKEGYGLNFYGIEKLYEQGIDTLITVDCGITNIEEVKRAKELGIDVIITDHHYPKELLPPADIIINPKLRKDCPYPNLAGVGIAFLLVAAVSKMISNSKTDIKNYLDLVALGTLADVVELSLENRILVKNGLLFLNEAKRPGIFALKESANLSPYSEIGTYEVCYILAPRINSAGRIDDPKIALDLLLTEDLEEARKLAKRLNSLNQKRQREEEKILKEAIGLVSDQVDQPAFVLYSSDWHEGIIGIVASRLVEEFYRPVILLTQNQSLIKGSGRSIPEFHLFDGLKGCKAVLKAFGGHAQAAGLSLDPSNIEEFRSMFVSVVKDHLKDKALKPTILIDDRLSFKHINLNFLKELDLLQPYGPGNPKPIFCSHPLTIQKIKKIKEDHIALELRDNKAKRTFWGKLWRMSKFFSEDVVGKDIIVTFTPKINNFNDLISIDLDVTDWKLL